MYLIHYYLHQDGDVFGHVGLFVCMAVRRITFSTYLHASFTKGVSRAKDLSIIFWG